MSISAQNLTLEKLQTPEGIQTLNSLLAKLSRSTAGDGETVKVTDGIGDPTDTVAAGVGSMYLRTDGGEGTSVYIKESGTDASGWAAVGGGTKSLKFVIMDPNAVYGVNPLICLWPKLPSAITITKIEVTLDATTNEIAGDLKWANAFIGLAGATVINDFDTTSGVRSDSSITSPTVAAEKCLYLSFDSEPHADIKEACFEITYS